MRKQFLVAWILLISMGLFAQQYLDGSKTIVNGFDSSLSGDVISYHSSIPVAKDALLIRATDGNSGMEWITSPIPPSVETPYVTFIWLAGIGSSPGNASFDLLVNGKNSFTFWADGSDTWKLISPDGYELYFKQDRVDQHGDRFGFMYLTIPTKNLESGKSLNLKMVGGRFNKTSWYMTFLFPIKDGLTFKSLPALANIDGKTRQLGVAGILHFGQPDSAKVFIDEKLVTTTPLQFGYNYVKIFLPEVEKAKTVNYELALQNQSYKGQLELFPVKKWRVNFVQHSHTDIGYTRSQTDILAEHLRYIDYALDYCDITDSMSADAQFRWTCEASWAVDEYLRSRTTAQVDRLRKRVNEGRIEITGMYFNFDDLPDEQTLAASLKPIERIKSKGFDVKTAMQNDVNGIGWALCDYYNDLGVKYLNMGTHGHRALICFDVPTLFWWESPSGKRMLAFRAEHYMTGNTVFKIHSGDFNLFEDELLSYLQELEKKGYPYDLISIQHSGYLVDNSPPSTAASTMIEQWNNKYSWPKLKTATATEFFVEMESKYSADFQVIRGAWPDWWTDGFGASAREVAATREAQTDLIANTAGLTMAALSGIPLPSKIEDRVETTNQALLFYTEHTVGYHASVREPFHQYTMEQRAIKESYAWEAARRAKMIGEETMGLLQSSIQREKNPSIVVFNTLNWTRSGLFTVYIDHQILPRYTNFSITDQMGKELKAQPVEHHSDGTYWAVWADNIPAFGYKKFIISLHGKTTETFPAKDSLQTIFENNWYKLVIDPYRGAISQITDKELGMDLIDSKSPYILGEFIYELLQNRSQMESKRLDNFTREGLEKVWFDGYEAGQVWNTLRFRGNTRAAFSDGGFAMEIRLFNTTKRIDLAFFIDKKMVTDPEGIYISFPFMMENGQLSFDVQGGEMRAGIDQIPGSSNDWNSVQNYARLSNEKAQILLTSPEMPLMQFGGINTGRYKAGAQPQSTHIFGWPMNNYWVTNFNAEQHGGLSWVYNITSLPGNSQQDATRFGWGNRVPFLSRVLPGGGVGEKQWEKSLLTGWASNILLISAIPDGEGKYAIFHVREIDGKTADFNLVNSLNGKKLPATQVDVTGETLKNGSTQLKPFESKFFKVNLME